MLVECSVSWGKLELICDGLHVSLPSWIISSSELKETEAEADTEAETKAIAEAEVGTEAVAVTVHRIIL